jgi:FKBP-type peptidyl-prolyl cis-trans isomerase 2
MKITAGSTVRVEYELKVEGGAVVESSQANGPLEYVHGEHRLLPALERHLEGMAVGDEKRGKLAAREAFGDESMLPVRDLLKKEFAAGEQLTVGRVFAAKAPGQAAAVRFKIVAVEGELVKVRFLHELAERDIEFRVKVLGVEPPHARRSVLRPPPPPAQALGIDTGSIVLLAPDDAGDDKK